MRQNFLDSKFPDSGVPTTPILLASAAGAAALINAVIGDGKLEGSKNSVLRWSALVLSLTILPLAIIAAISMSVRIDEYGLTPDRIWGVIAVIVASVYGVAYLYAAIQSGRSKAWLDWDDDIRPANIRIAQGVCALALFLALPVFDFGSISASDQIGRLKKGLTTVDEFDWRAMAFDFGPKGRAALAQIVKNGPEAQQKSAKAALASDNRWDIEAAVKAGDLEKYDKNFSYQPTGRSLDEDGRRALVADRQCSEPCRIIWLAENRFLVVGTTYEDGLLETTEYLRLTQAEVDVLQAEDAKKGYATRAIPKAMVWERADRGLAREAGPGVKELGPQSKVELRPVELQQVYVDGQAVGTTFEK